MGNSSPTSSSPTLPEKVPDKAMESILLSSLQRTIEFLKYAEAKNGALLTFASAWILAILNISFKDGINEQLKVYQYAVLPFLIVAGFTALISFFPLIRLPEFLGGRRAGPHRKNLLYFGDVGDMTVSEFHKAVRDSYYPPDGRDVSEAYINDLMTQIAVNSQITIRKMRLFQFGLRLVAFAGVAFIIVASAELFQVVRGHL